MSEENKEQEKLTPQQIVDNRKKVIQYYKVQILVVELQAKYEELLASIETSRAKSRAGERHIASRDRHERVSGGSNRSVGSAQGAAVRFQVRVKRDVQEGISGRMVCRHNDFIRNGRKPVHNALDEGAAKKRFEGFILPHAGGLPASLYTNG